MAVCMLRAMNPARSAIESALARLAQVGADDHDDEELRLRKALLLLISLLILPIALVWGSLYLAFGTQAGYVAYLYFGVLLGAILVFARNHDFAFLLRVALLDILLAPTLSMIPVGGFLGFRRGGAVGHPRAPGRSRLR